MTLKRPDMAMYKRMSVKIAAQKKKKNAAGGQPKPKLPERKKVPRHFQSFVLEIPKSIELPVMFV